MKYQLLFLFTLFMGLGKENGLTVGLPGGGAPDFDAYERMVKNVSKHRGPGQL